MRLARGTRVLTTAFAVSGVVHLVRPRTFAPLMPRWVPAHRQVILGSGVAELACAVALNVPAARRWGGWASVLLLLGVYPGNLKMAVDATRGATRGNSVALAAVALGRLPLQVPLVRAALRAAHG